MWRAGRALARVEVGREAGAGAEAVCRAIERTAPITAFPYGEVCSGPCLHAGAAWRRPESAFAFGAAAIAKFRPHSSSSWERASTLLAGPAAIRCHRAASGRGELLLKPRGAVILRSEKA